ncbi:MAG: LuxR C-terminal-related transcriptional regulator [Ignavibacteriaceae bacterium]
MGNSAEIIGRTKEKSKLHLALDQARNGTGGLLLVNGEAGVGKTTLIEEVLSHSGSEVLISRANEEGNPPYSLITSILRICLRKNTNWADHATIEFLSYISSRINNHPILIIASYRSDGITRGHKINRLRGDLRRARILNEINITTLDLEETRSFISRLLNKSPSSELSDLLYSRTQGIPFFIEELTNALNESGNIDKSGNEAILLNIDNFLLPESIKDTILQNLDSLTSESIQQIELAAVAGIEFDLNMIVDLNGNDKGLDALFEKNLIREKESNIAEFRHALIREAVESEMMWTRRKKLHRQIAAYLENKNTSPEIVAEHWIAANELDKARKSLTESAETSCSMYAFEDASEYANKALEIWPDNKDETGRIEVLKRLAHCSQLSGKLNEAIRALKEIIESQGVAEQHQLAAEVFRSLATVYGLKGSWELSVATRINSAEEFEKAGLSADAASEYLAAAGRYVGMMQTNSALDVVNKSIDLAQKANRIDIEAMARGLCGNILSMQGEFDKGREIVQQALSLALKNNETDAASIIYRRLASALEYASDYLSARDAYYNAYNFCVTESKDVSAQICLSCMSYTLFQTGEWKKSLEFCREVISSVNTPENSIPVGYSMMGLIFAFRGETKKAFKNLKKGLRLARKLNVTAAELLVLWGLAVAYENDSDIPSAIENYRSVITLWEKTQDHHDIIPVFIWASKIFASKNLGKEATQCAEALASIASATGNPEAMAALAYTLGEKALLNNNVDEAITQFSQALNHIDKLEIPLEKLFIELRLGTVLSTKESSKAAINHFNNAIRISKKLGTRPFSEQIEDIIKTVGIDTKQNRKEDSDERKVRGGLTKRQLGILDLLSQGLTNKEIAAKLFLSTRTIDMHVSHVLERLNCRSRIEAINKAKELGIL